MHLLGAALAYHRDDASGGRAADQRIVDDDRLLAVEYPRLGIEFDGDPDVIIRLLINGYLAVIRQALRGLPRGADISITPQLEWFTVLVEKFLRVPQA